MHHIAYLNLHMAKDQPLIILITLLSVVATIDLPLHVGTATCTAIISSFDVLSV
jgi:hypothetical protein